MPSTFKMKTLASVLLSLGLSTTGIAQTASTQDIEHRLEQLTQRMQKLEQLNAELLRALASSRAASPASSSPAAGALEQRLHLLEQQQNQLNQSLASDTISEKEPEVSARIKALEAKTDEMGGPVEKLKSLEGISGGFSLTTVAQKSFDNPAASADTSQLGYRADATLSLPLEALGDVDQSLFVHLRTGQGKSLGGLPGLYSAPNATAFQFGGATGSDDAVLLLAEAWYQASIPLPWGGFKPDATQALEITFGKMDPFAFFDQNAVAGDETKQFLNSVFVHNPLLDAGGDIGGDANGFKPGLRLSLLDSSNKLERWRFSMGVFGAGSGGGANYQRTANMPAMVMLQAETEQRFFGGLVGNYRIYTWSNPQAAHFDSVVTAPETHIAWGLSVDQRVGDGLTVFGRYGHETQGNVKFDRALTLGLQASGSYWQRGADSIGVALGHLRTSDAYSAFKGGANQGVERVAELYYRYSLAKQFELSPSLQYISNPGGDGNAAPVRILGLRSQLTF